MRVLNLSSHDYANQSHENANALRSIGVDCVDLRIYDHIFNYSSQSTRSTYNTIHSLYKKFDIIQIFHSDEKIFHIVRQHPNVVIYHTGTRYRENKRKLDILFKGRKIITDQCEFLIHNKSFHYLAPYTNLQPISKPKRSRLILGHYPSKPDVKGTDDIIQMIQPFKNQFDFKFDTRRVPHIMNLKRVSDCHIYVELFKPTLNGLPYGCFGVSAFEATAMGSVVVTNNINPSAYEKTYGNHPFLIPGTKEEFQDALSKMVRYNDYIEIKEQLHLDFYNKHGIEQTGERIKSIIV